MYPLWILIAFLIAFPLCTSPHNIYRNRKLGNDKFGKQWHRAQWGEWLVFYLLADFYPSDFPAWLVVLPLAVAGWIFFDGTQNLYTFPDEHRSFFYAGEKDKLEKTTSSMDLFFMRFEKPELAKFLAELIILILSLTPLTIYTLI